MSDSEHAPRISEILDAIAGSKRKTVSVQDVLEAFDHAIRYEEARDAV